MNLPTPGPYFVYGHNLGELTINAADDQEQCGEEIAVIRYDDETELQAEVNARLLAGAPEVAKALWWITRCPTISGPFGDPVYVIDPKRMEAARAALDASGMKWNADADTFLRAIGER